jgi:hypothetical protein
MILLQTIFGSILGLGNLIVYLAIPQVKNSLNILFARLFRIETLTKELDIGSTSFDILSEFNISVKERLGSKTSLH